ncbi:MAG TPA: hypothetical protein VF731_06285 [Solirubrobacterales bacterium]
MPPRRVIGTLAVAIAVLALAVGIAAARPGPRHRHPARLDPSFGTNGRVIGTTFTKGYLYSALAAASPGDSIVAMLGETISRFLPSGQLDPSFGQGGSVELPNLEAKGELLFPAGIAVDAEGRVLVAATRWSGEHATLPGLPYFLENRELATVIRYLPDGQLDPSFGQGGIASTDFGLPPAYKASAPSERLPWPTPRVTGLAVDPQGRIVVAGVYATGVHQGCKPGPRATAGAFVGRLTASGLPDPTFAGGGAATLSNLDYGFATVATGPREQIVLGTQHPDVFLCFPPSEGKGRSLGSIVRIGPAGGIDGRFSGNGVLNTDGSVRQLALTGSGRILALISLGDYSYPRSGEAEVLRLQPSGAFDRRFGQRGRVRLYGAIDALAPGGHGRVLLAGATGIREAPADFLLIRLTRSGAFDSSVGVNGQVVAGFGNEQASANDLVLDERGRPILVGTIKEPSTAITFPTLALTRLLLPR